MDDRFMAFMLSKPLHFGAACRHGALLRLSLLFLLGVLAMRPTPAAAQTVVGGDRGPSVTVNSGVLDQLGPAPTLPQLFGAERGLSVAAPSEAGARRAPTLHRPAPKRAHSAKATRTRVARRHASKKTRVSKRTTHVAKAGTIHLTPPGTQHPTQTAQATTTRGPAAAAPTIVKTAPPAPAPIPPAPQSIPTPSSPTVATSAPPTEPPVEKPSSTPPPPAVSLMATPSSADTAAAAPALPAQPPAAAQTMPTAAPAPTPAPATESASAGSTAGPAPVQVASAGSFAVTPTAVKFAPGASDLPPNAQSVLDNVADKLLASENLRVQLIAHATGGPDQAMEARRISLARAVAVRAYLIDKGVRSLRMDVRALGNRPEDGPVNDQVDLVLVNQ